MITLEKSLETIAKDFEKIPTTYRFDIFKGEIDSQGKIKKIRTVGIARLTEGNKTYVVYLKSLLKDVFYLLPEQKQTNKYDYVILTREDSRNPNKKFYWNNVGEGIIFDGVNAGLMQLSFDIFGSNDLFMSLHPFSADAVTTSKG